MSEIQQNGHIRVPKGTMVYPTGDGVPAPSTREQVVKVKKIFDVDVKSDSFYLLLPDDMRLRYFEATGGRPVDADILEFTDRLTGGDYRAVEWTGKWALIGDVQYADAPARAKSRKEKAPEKPLTKLDQMVRGSVWRFTQDADLRYKVSNPAYAGTRDDIQNSLQAAPLPCADACGRGEAERTRRGGLHRPALGPGEGRRDLHGDRKTDLRLCRRAGCTDDVSRRALHPAV